MSNPLTGDAEWGDSGSINGPAAMAVTTRAMTLRDPLRWPTAAARDAAFTAAAITATRGMMCTLDDSPGVVWVHDGTTWLATSRATSWASLTLGAGWSATPGYPPQYRAVHIGSAVQVYTRGMALRGASGDVASIANIPAPYRPSVTVAVGSSVTTDGKAVELFVTTAGDFWVPAGYATGSVAVGNSIPLAAAWMQ